ncbi:MAG: replicative DNA helicase [Lachnospiraceae bacterium]|nr:replicative DNA helicase [Lachnospiraceae bacterium]
MDDTAIRRIMPHDSAAEESVVGSMLFDKEAIDLAGELLLKEDFYEKQYGIVFEAMVELNNAGKSVDMVTLQSYLKEKDVPDEIASLEFLQGIMQLYITSSNVKQYAEIVKKHSLLRRLIRVSDEISNDCYSQNKSLNVIFEDTEKKIFDIVQRKNTGDFTPINKIVETSIKRLQTIMMSGSRITGISTGFTDLDNTLSGLQPSDLILIAARPSMGKTAFALNIAQFAAVREKNCTAVFSLEMSKEQLVNRLLAMDATVDAQKLRNADLDDNEIEYIMESAVNLGSSKLIIDDTSGISVSELRTKCRKYKIENDLKLVIIDYLQLMSGGGRNESRQQEISDISRSLKSLAREINVPVVALSQLSRAVEKRDDHRPMLSDLRESGAIEQDADVVMFLYREDYYNKDTERKNIAEVIVAKQRNGPIKTTELVWNPQFTKFRNMSSESFGDHT